MMKKILPLVRLLSIVVLSLLGTRAFGQVATNYTWSQSAGTYVGITGGSETVATASGYSPAGLDDVVQTFTIPSFTYNGVAYTSASISTNGFMTFGTAPTTTNYIPIQSSETYGGSISAWGRDLNGFAGIGGLTSTITVGVLGTAPNRITVFQWKNFRSVASTSTSLVPYINFQIRLYETSNRIEVVYGSSGFAAGSANTAGSAQIGLRGPNNTVATNVNNRQNAATVVFGSSSPGTLNASVQNFTTASSPPGMPENGLTYTWTPPAGCTTPAAQPSALTFGTTSAAAIAGSFTGVASPNTPSGYMVVRSTSATAPTPANGTAYANGSTALGTGTYVVQSINATTFSDTGLTSNTRYYYYVFSYNSGCSGAPFYKSTLPLTGNKITCPAPPTSPVTSGVTATTANVSWTAAAAGGNAETLKYRFELYTNPARTAVVAGYPLTDTTSPVSTSGLNPNTTYYYRIVSYNSSCNSTNLDGIFTTNCQAAIITGAAGERCGAGSLTLSATTNVPATVNWYSALTGGTSLFTGNNFATPSISNTTDYFAEATIPSAPINIPIGSGALTTSSSGTSSGNFVSPFSHYYGGYKSQYVIRKDELDAAGFKAGSLTSISLDVTSAGTTYNGFAINIGNTTNTAATATFATPSFTNVFSGNVTPAVGVFTINFTTPFEWDGTSNVIVQLCWSNNDGGGTAAEVKYDTSSFVSMAYYRVDSAAPAAVCSATTASGTLSARPRLYFNNIGICKSSPRTKVTATINPTATPINILATTTSSGGNTACDVDYVELKATGGLVDTLNTILTQDFTTTTTTLPIGWSQNGPDSNTTWSGVNTSNAGGAANEMVLDAIGAGFSDSGTYALNTPVVNATNLSNLNLKFKNYVNSYDPIAYPFTLKIQTSPNGFSGWTDRWTFTPTVSGATSASTVSVDLSTLDNNNSIYIRFAFVGRSFGLFRWAIDDVILTGTSPSQSAISWSPLLGLYTDVTLETPYKGQNLTTVFAAPDTDTSYTATTSLATCNESKIQDVSARLKKVFTGLSSTPTLWNEPNNWTTKEIPTSDKCVSIPSTQNVVVNINDAAARKVTVDAGGRLTINPLQGLKIEEGLINNNSNNLIPATNPQQYYVSVESDGNLLQNSTVSNIGNISVKREINNSTLRKQYNYMSAPVFNPNFKNIYKNADGTAVVVPFVTYYKESNNRFYNFTGIYMPGQGLSIKEPTNAAFSGGIMTSVFTGVPYDGEPTFSMLNSNISGDFGYNLLGNPYPSNLDLNIFYSENNTPANELDPTFYFWNSAVNDQYEQNGNDYDQVAYARYNAATGTGTRAPGSSISDTKKPNGIVKVAQGFIGRSLIASKTAQFKNIMRTAAATPAFFGKDANGTGEKDRFWLNLINPHNKPYNIAVVYLAGENDRLDFHDSRSFGGSDAIYSIVDGVNLDINGKNTFQPSDKVQLGTNYFIDGNYTISLDEKDGVFNNGQSIYLKDKQNGVITNLSQGSYTFSATAGVNTGRFEIIYQPETVLATDLTTKEELVVYTESGDFVVKAQSKKITDLQVFDMNGRLFMKLQPNKTKVVIPASTLINGVYLLKIDQGGVITNKKIIR